jgi:hypothetical protein
MLEIFAAVFDDALDGLLKHPCAFFYLFGMFLKAFKRGGNKH